MKRFWTILATGLFLALCTVHGASQDDPTSFVLPVPAHSPSTPALVFIEAPVVAASGLAQRFPQGSRLVRMTAAEAPGTVLPLTPGFFAAADPQVSFDGSRILFSAKKTKQDAWQVWEIAADGSGLQQITRGPGDYLQPKYLPQNQIVYSFIRADDSQRGSTVYVSQMDGTSAHPITFGPGNFQVETVLSSGRILVSAEALRTSGSNGNMSRTLFTLLPDGSGLTLLRDDVTPGKIRGGAIELTDGTIVFVESAENRSGGQLASIRRGALRASILSIPPAAFASVAELPDSTLLVARQNSLPAKNRNFDLYRFNPASKSVGDLLYHNAKSSSVDAVPLTPHTLPQIYWSVLHPAAQTGRIICLDSYISQDVESGRLDGHIAKIRVIALEPSGHHEQIVGDAPVELDGSLYATVPINTPIRFELLDAKGNILHAQRSWIWVRNGEDRGCQGCHDSPLVAPENHFPMALRRLDSPASMGNRMHTQREGQQ